MLLILKTLVTAHGVPGPLLGDGVKTVCTPLTTTVLVTPSDSMGHQQSVLNLAAASGRAHYDVSRFVIIGLGANTGVAYLMAAGQTATVARRAGPYEELTPIGYGHRNVFDLGDLDVDAAADGEGWLVFAEVA